MTKTWHENLRTLSTETAIANAYSALGVPYKYIIIIIIFHFIPQ